MTCLLEAAATTVGRMLGGGATVIPVRRSMSCARRRCRSHSDSSKIAGLHLREQNSSSFPKMPVNSDLNDREIRVIRYNNAPYVSDAVAAIKRHVPHTVSAIDIDEFARGRWREHTQVLVTTAMDPIQFAEEMHRRGCLNQLRTFPQEGGHILGFCALGYLMFSKSEYFRSHLSKPISFPRGFPLVKGLATGPQLIRRVDESFDHPSAYEAQAAPVQFTVEDDVLGTFGSTAVFHCMGPRFHIAPDEENVVTLAKFNRDFLTDEVDAGLVPVHSLQKRFPRNADRFGSVILVASHLELDVRQLRRTPEKRTQSLGHYLMNHNAENDAYLRLLLKYAGCSLFDVV